MLIAIIRNTLLLVILLWANILFAQYPEVTIREIQEVPPGQDTSFYRDQIVHTAGIVTAATYLFYAGSGHVCYMGMSEGGPFSGVMVYFPSGCPYLLPGDSISIDATVIEREGWPHITYGYHTELEIEPGSFQLHSFGNPVPAPMIITAADIDTANGADSLAEQYEGCLVRLYDVTVDSVIVYVVTSTWFCHDLTDHNFMVHCGSDSIEYIPTPGTELEYMQGLIYPRSGSYKVRPRYEYDIVLPDGRPVISDVEQIPENPGSNDSVTVICTITDDGEIVRADFLYRLNLGSWANAPMVYAGNDRYYFVFPPMPDGYRIDCAIEAEDDEGNVAHWPEDYPWNFHIIYVYDQSAINNNLMLPLKATLYQNYPNPFNASTSINFTLPEASLVTLKVYDLLGREAAILAEKWLPAGIHSVKFAGPDLPSGIYFYQLRTSGFTQTKRMNLVK